MRSGYVTLRYGYLGYAGREGDYWATTAFSSTNYAYRFYFYPTGVNPSYYNNRYIGYSLRCLQE